MTEKFSKKSIRIAFFLKLEFFHAMLDPVYEILSKEFLCMFSSNEEEIINFQPHVIIQANYDHENFRKYLPCTLLVSLQHGFGTKNNSKRLIPHVDIVCISNPWFEELCRQKGIHPRIAMWVTGFVPMDKIFNTPKKTKNLPKEFGSDPTILYAPTFNEYLNSVDVLGFDWIDQLTKTRSNLNLIIKPHPVIASRFPEWIKKWNEIAKNNPKVFLVENSDEDVYEYFHQASILLTDVSSVMFFYLALDRPIILVTNSQRMEAKEVFDPEGAEWNWRDMGIEVNDSAELISAIDRSLKEPALHSKQRATYRQKVYGSLELGSAAKNTAAKISDFLDPKDEMISLWLNVFSTDSYLYTQLKESQKIISRYQKEFDIIKKSRTMRMCRFIDKIIGLNKS
jgi:CDP-glycerol glycerophosphotransferase (TagB/SpsB family)